MSAWWTMPHLNEARPDTMPAMTAATPTLLVARRHVDFGRMRSMVCCPA
ncbi:MAG TPA: hypothetical protein VK585_06955 [Jiangellaceae bacterium]|nr:hypothetical protein [Jiangellaceae bacterium]